jgi:hypothetical protein
VAPRRCGLLDRDTVVGGIEMTPRRVEQIFLERKGGVVEVLLVLEDDAGGRTRERFPVPTVELAEAIRLSAQRLARRGVGPTRRVRLRVVRQGEMYDDGVLLDLFLGILGDDQDAYEGC